MLSVSFGGRGDSILLQGFLARQPLKLKWFIYIFSEIIETATFDQNSRPHQISWEPISCSHDLEGAFPYVTMKLFSWVAYENTLQVYLNLEVSNKDI